MYCIAKGTAVHLKNGFGFLPCVNVRRRFLSAGTSNSNPSFYRLVFLRNVFQCQKCHGETFHHAHRSHLLNCQKISPSGNAKNVFSATYDTLTSNMRSISLSQYQQNFHFFCFLESCVPLV